MFDNVLFLASGGLTLLGCILMLSTKNLMHSCVYLLSVLIGVAGLYLTLGADFVAVTQTMVYVGGVVILMLFAVMLTGGKDFVSRAQKILGLLPAMGNKFTFGIGVFTALVFTLSQFYLMKNIFQSVEVMQDKAYAPTIDSLGELLITDHVLPFELSSVLLLGALVGAAIIARPRKEKISEPNKKVEEQH